MFVKKVTDIGQGITEVMHNTGHIDYRSQRTDNKHTAPIVLDEYMDGDVRMYECVGGRHFIANIYDSVFKAPKGQLMPKNYKGQCSFYRKRR